MGGGGGDLFTKTVDLRELICDTILLIEVWSVDRGAMVNAKKSDIPIIKSNFCPRKTITNAKRLNKPRQMHVTTKIQKTNK